jgi:hypothetical protein
MGKRKAIDCDVDGPSIMKRKNHKDRADWVSKYIGVTDEEIRSAGYEANSDGIPMMSCVKCGVLKERTTDYFSSTNVNRDFEKWFSRIFPSFNNSNGHPCNACHKLINRAKKRDLDGNGWLRHLVGNYKLPIEWGTQRYVLPVGDERCWATGCTLPFQKGGNAFSLGVNSLNIQTEKYDQQKCHDTTEIVAVYQWTNCPQTVNGSNHTKVIIIPSLREAYTEMYRQMIMTYEMGPEELKKIGDNRAKLMKSDADFGNMAQASKTKDRKRGLKNNMSASRILDTVRAHRAICCTSGILMTSFSTSGGVRGPYDVHMDRIRDAFSESPEGHVDTNVEFKCRLFNNNHLISRKDFLLVFLNQLLVPIPESVRALAQADFESIPRSSRDAWTHGE